MHSRFGQGGLSSAWVADAQRTSNVATADRTLCLDLLAGLHALAACKTPTNNLYANRIVLLHRAKDVFMPHQVLVIVGSLRKESFSLKIANALAKTVPASLKLSVATLHGLSFFNQDLEANPPADWLAFRDKIKASDAVIFVTPEYNRSISGVLRNAIDVASRPSGQSAFLGKPVGIIGNSPGPLGGVSAAIELKRSLPGITGPILGQPEIYLTHIGNSFNEQGEVTNEHFRKVLHQYGESFAAFVERQKKAAAA